MKNKQMIQEICNFLNAKDCKLGKIGVGTFFAEVNDKKYAVINITEFINRTKKISNADIKVGNQLYSIAPLL